MDDFYSIAVNSDPKHGLGLSSSDLETFQFPTLCEELDQEQLLALDDPQSFYLAFPDTGVFGACDEALSRASSAVTPQSDCSTRTTTSARNLSPTSDILTFQDKPTTQDIEAMYHDTTQSIISSRQSRAASATWPSANTSQSGMSSILTPPLRTISHRPQSFSYRTPQISQKATTPPPPSTFFPSPSMQQQTATSRSPFVSPNLATIGSQIPQLQSQNAYMRAGMMGGSSYYGQPQPQPFQQSSNPAFQQQLQQHFQQQNLSLQQPITHRRSIQGPLPTQTQMAAPLFNRPQLSSQSSMPNPTTTTINSTTATPTLPNTTGNSSTGYQCFSHGCGGRHFSNWGNLVRHHRERQLRSKAGAKPTCPRCGKGFTRSSARDAHVAGLKCVLGRRRRGGAGPGNQSSASAPEVGIGSGDAAAESESSPGGGAKMELADGDTSIEGLRNGDLQVKDRDRDHDHITELDADHDHDQYQDNGSDSSREDIDLGDADEDEDEDNTHEAELLGSKSLASHARSSQHHHHIPPAAAATAAAAATVTAAQLAAQVAATDALAFGLGLSTSGDPGRSYLAPQQLHFGH